MTEQIIDDDVGIRCSFLGVLGGFLSALSIGVVQGDNGIGLICQVTV